MSSDDDEKIRPYNPDDDDDDNDDEKIRPAGSDEEKEKEFTLFIKEVSGKSTPINCSPSDKISQLKEKIYEKTNIKTINQRLTFGVQQLSDDNKTIKDYEITDGSTIHLIIRLTGGLF